jgi:hypothetical protein
MRLEKEGTTNLIEMEAGSILEDIQEEKVVAQFNKYIQENYLLQQKYMCNSLNNNYL